MLRSLCVASLFAIGLAACSTPAMDYGTDPILTPPGEKVSVEGERATQAERAACEASGGDIIPGGRLGWDHCVRQFDDVGQSCTGPQDCQGRCMVDGNFVDDGKPVTGVCSADDNPFGCQQTVTNGTADPALCVD